MRPLPGLESHHRSERQPVLPARVVADLREDQVILDDAQSQSRRHAHVGAPAHSVGEAPDTYCGLARLCRSAFPRLTVPIFTWTTFFYTGFLGLATTWEADCDELDYFYSNDS